MNLMGLKVFARKQKLKTFVEEIELGPEPKEEVMQAKAEMIATEKLDKKKRAKKIKEKEKEKESVQADGEAEEVAVDL